MKAVLLAAGFGTRLRPLTDHTPKCLVPIRTKPLLGYWLDLLFADGKNLISEAIVNTHYLADQVIAYLENSPWRSRLHLVHEETLLGTGGTVLENQQQLCDGPFILAHADNLTRFNLNDFIEAHTARPKNIEITMMTFDTDAPERSGIVELDDQQIIRDFHEKSPIFKGTRANAAVYILEPSVIAFLQTLNRSIIDFSTEVIPHYLGRMQAFHNADYHRDIGTPESLQLAEKEF